mmetsp:Transcript_36582/g.58762  ORF Transcript_36582/g.58762 Transcript_36582/m.58762 type:complete len:225 (-) Transcript_36582:788-1462(-)
MRSLRAISCAPPATPAPCAPSCSRGSRSTLKQACAMGSAPAWSRRGAASSPSVNGTASPMYPTRFRKPPAGGDDNPVANCNTARSCDWSNVSIARQKHWTVKLDAMGASAYAACARQSSSSMAAAPAISTERSAPPSMPFMRVRSCGGTTAPNPAANAAVWSRTDPTTRCATSARKYWSTSCGVTSLEAPPGTNGVIVPGRNTPVGSAVSSHVRPNPPGPCFCT